MKQLSLKQKLFIKQYLLYKGNATQAAREAYNVKNFKVAAVIVSQNITNDKY